MIRQMIEMDHSKKYMVIDGHLITLSFSKAPNPDLFGRIKSILLSSGTVPQNCRKPDNDAKIRESKKEA